MQLVGVILFESTNLQNLASAHLFSWLPAPLALYTLAFSVPLTMPGISYSRATLLAAPLSTFCFLQYMKCFFFWISLGVFWNDTLPSNEDFHNQHILNCINLHLFLSYTIPFWYIRYSVCLHSSIHYHENTMQRSCRYCSLPRTLLGRQQTFSNYLSNISMNQYFQREEIVGYSLDLH